MVGDQNIWLDKYFPEIGQKHPGVFDELYKLYLYWNAKINVVSRKDIDNLFLHHIVHSLSLLKFDEILEGARVLDVGTGGGFPGIPLSIVFPNVSFDLVDGRNKKILVVNEIIRTLKLENAEGIHTRSEDVVGKYDVVMGRAVTEFQEFAKMVWKNLKPGGVIYYWTGGAYKSIRNQRNVDIFKLEEVFEEDHFRDKYILKYRIK